MTGAQAQQPAGSACVKPGAHAEQAPAPAAAEDVPSGQVLHDPASSVEYLPATQRAQAEAPADANLPSA